MLTAHPTKPLFFTTASSECKVRGYKDVALPREAIEALCTYSLMLVSSVFHVQTVEPDASTWAPSSPIQILHGQVLQAVWPFWLPYLRIVRHLHDQRGNEVT